MAKKKTSKKHKTKKKVTKKRSTRKAAAAVMEVVTGGPGVTPPPPKIEPSKAEEKSAPSKRYRGKCAYCNKVNDIFWAECDEHWELPGHPDHIFRNVCVNCTEAAGHRDDACQLVYEAMKLAMEDKDMTGVEISDALTVARRSIDVGFDDKALIKLAKQLKVKHPWLKGKRSK
jgi:hypothetical protein